MIKTEAEYQECLRRLEEDLKVIQAQREKLEQCNLPEEQLVLAMEPVMSFHEQLKEEVEWYERVKRRDFGIIRQLNEIGPLLVALRIANGVTQSELAKRLNVDVSQVSRDERNDYHGISIERAERVVNALGEELEISVGRRRATGNLMTAS
ncbi:MAG: helix-turn-helix domain-containing protein [Candidatus Obscuribacterales bacterium]|nr:helix-turn-helix domain-containing protein [Candidatus Obscuribacterales bacterium]